MTLRNFKNQISNIKIKEEKCFLDKFHNFDFYILIFAFMLSVARHILGLLLIISYLMPLNCATKRVTKTKDLPVESRQGGIEQKPQASLATGYEAIPTKEIVSRADFAALLVRETNLSFSQANPIRNLNPSKAENLSVSNGTSLQITDIQGHWAEREICEGVKRGLVVPFPDGSFRPDEPLTRIQAALLLEKIWIKARRTLPEKESYSFSDVPSNDYTFKAAVLTVQQGLLQAKKTNYFGRNEFLSGTEVVTCVRNLRERLLNAEWRMRNTE